MVIRKYDPDPVTPLRGNGKGELIPSYNIHCLDCPYGASTGQALFQAQLLADKHHRKQPLHRIQLRKGTTVIEIRVPKMQPFGVDNDEPPY